MVEIQPGHLPPFYLLLGVVVDERVDLALVRLPFKAELANSRGHVHGGGVASLIDVTLARASRLAYEGISGLATVDVTVHYLAPAVGDLECRGRVIGTGRTISVAEASVVDSEGTLVARATGTLRLFSSQTGT